MNNSAQTEAIKYPSAFVAQVTFKEDCKWFQKYGNYFFRSDKISPNTVDNLYLHYCETEKFVEKEINKTIVSAVIWNNTGVGKKKVYERTTNVILLPRQVSVEWFTPTFDNESFGKWQEQQFKLEQEERKQDWLHHSEVFAAYRNLLNQKR